MLLYDLNEKAFIYMIVEPIIFCIANLEFSVLDIYDLVQSTHIFQSYFELFLLLFYRL